MKEIEEKENIIFQGMQELDELHPISKTPFEVAFPRFSVCIKCWKNIGICMRYTCCCCINANIDRHQERIMEIQEEKQKNMELAGDGKGMAAKDDEDDKDPFKRLGFGLMSYRSILTSLTICFVLLTCINLPVMEIYSRGKVFDEGDPKNMLGNLGYSSVKCSISPF